MSKNLIYVLIDPRNGEFRYIGMTKNGVSRPKEHTKESKYGDTHKARWIRKLQSLNLKYKIGILQELKRLDQLAAAEIKWISFYRGCGARLTNATDGGDGLLNPTKEVRAKFKGENNGMYGREHTQESIEKMSESTKGRNNPNYGKKLSSEIRKKMSGKNNSMYGKTPWNKGIPFSSETRRKMSEAHKDQIPWNKGLKSEQPSLMKGKKVSQETRRRQSESQQKRRACEKAAQEAAI